MILGSLLLAVALGCSATNISLPPVTESPTDIRDPGRIVWHDLITDKPAESRKFYAELFGWEFEGVGNLFGLGGEDTYSLIRHNGRLIGGMVNEERLQNQSDNVSQWIALMSVEDVDQAAQQFASNGGEILTPPTDIAQRGRMAVVVDPQGALLALVQTIDGDPEWREPGYGDFLWNELWTADVSASSTFYAGLAGFDSEDVPIEGDRNYRVLSRNDRPTLGVLAHPFEEERPVWVTYVRVEDPATITSQVEALGGKVYVETQDRPLGGQVALIADPSGAGIALQTWPFDKD